MVKLIFITLFSMGVLHCEEGLHFAFTERKLQPKVTDTVVMSTFPFTNAGKTPVTITELKTSCGCTTADLEKRTYAAGEAGEITMAFTVGDFTGLQTKLVTVKTDEPGSPPIFLRMEIQLPEGPSPSQRFIDWYVGAGPSKKTIFITLPKDPKFHMQRVECADKRLKISLDPGQDENHYLISIIPTETTRPYAAAIDVITDLRTIHVYARIIEIIGK
ncbi:MAG: DUF1573 domain-containing protein [Planctomycetes bacterium]|nr:DUF1573 domain-containing protein [Planctomycetota bacterium]